ncbi:hypothetical protein MNV49_005819 [Pseudohyphozyma bogoriensis]|nr:hypothetical protein MNV49_005819 [Pseudohyphozyma bogoriensis]
MANTVNSAVPTNLAHGDIQLPPHLAARLEEDHERFGTKQTKEELEASIQAADQRRQDILDGKAAAGHQEVDHAKSVAATHEHKADVQQELLSRVETA